MSNSLPPEPQGVPCRRRRHRDISDRCPAPRTGHPGEHPGRRDDCACRPFAFGDGARQGARLQNSRRGRRAYPQSYVHGRRKRLHAFLSSDLRQRLRVLPIQGQRLSNGERTAKRRSHDRRWRSIYIIPNSGGTRSVSFTFSAPWGTISVACPLGQRASTVTAYSVNIPAGVYCLAQQNVKYKCTPYTTYRTVNGVRSVYSRQVSTQVYSYAFRYIRA